ncbi:ABC transporter substrate-binding protein [Streptomyces hoynatensis]|uniref:ABC transporter substrate-binding protein n=1 Tax=Streptomyces hoynatensis TaxID=1141874 RepID=A0A3A9YX75_9ACTN|nr:ABC transporter substrate-binding protein [Streptomyces hoynatensis]RKN39826.1 ABC transporter substrate-binding protein [Streptomyces hoynatensis]
MSAILHPPHGPGGLSRRALLGGLGGLGAAALAGCTPVARQVGSGGHGRQGGSLVMAQAEEPNLPTLRQQNNSNTSWSRLVFNSLTQYDHRTYRPRPQLATDWELTDGGRTVVLRLREDVTFHSGRPFGPRDVAENIAYQADEDGAPGQLRSAAAAVADHSVTGRNEITLRLAHGITNFFDLCEIMMIVDHESIAELESGEVINGTGPFAFAGYDPGIAMRFTRNPRYWLAGRPYLDEVELHIDSQPQAIVASLRSGQTDVAYALNGLSRLTVRDDDRLRLIEVDTRDAGYYVGCNVEQEPLGDKRVRQAISWAVDRQKVLDMALQGIGSVTSVPWTPVSPAYSREAAGHYHQDLDRARSLLAEAGVSGARLELAISGNEPGGVRSIAEIVLDGLRAVGLDASITPLQPAEFQQRLGTATLPGLWINGHGFGQLNPATMLNGAYPFNAARNASNFSDPTYLRLAEQVWTTSGQDAARAAYAEVTDFLLDQQFVIDLVSSSVTYATTRALHGCAFTMFNYLVLDEAFLGEG